MKIIKTEEEYEIALERLREIMHEDTDESELLSILIQDYEKKHYNIAPPPIVAHIPYFVYDLLYRATEEMPDFRERVEAWLENLPEKPKADWSKAPFWARYWTVDANGCAYWWENKPETVNDHFTCEWIDNDEYSCAENAGTVDIPIGIDWCTIIERR